ncbi:MAG: hypothetical protein P8166_08160 [Candidatus Thiodiazotropha sp.]
MVLEEQIKPLVESVGLEPLAPLEDSVRYLLRFLDIPAEHLPPSMLAHSCPLNMPYSITPVA